jgi:hypothetical protein
MQEQELIDAVSNKTGVSKDQAKQAIDVVAGYLEKKLPAPVAGQIRGALSGESGGSGKSAGGKASDFFGGMFGKKH